MAYVGDTSFSAQASLGGCTPLGTGFNIIDSDKIYLGDALKTWLARATLIRLHEIKLSAQFRIGLECVSLA